MNDHLDPGTVQSFLDEELPPELRQTTREHLATCPPCREQLAEAREANHTLAVALAELDPGAPRSESARLSRPPSMSRRAAPGIWSRVGSVKAAAMVLVFAAAASATIPGSPVRSWLAGEPDEVLMDAPVATTAAPEAAITAADEAGVSVTSPADVYVISIVDAADDVDVRARLIDGDRASVFGTGLGDATFNTGVGRIEVAGIEGGTLRIEIPRSAVTASVELDGEELLTKDADELRLVSDSSVASSAEMSFELHP